jgi:phosphate transport system substrate-binding protein
MKPVATIFALLTFACAAVRIGAQLPVPVRLAPSASQVLRIAGNPEMAALVEGWSQGFKKLHPAVHFEIHLTGSDTGIAALYTDKADLALIGRTPTPVEIQAFEWIYRYKPASVEIATGSLDHPGQSPALVVFVHHDNPLASLTLAQLDALFGTEHRFAPADIRTWDQLGLTGEWAGRPIHLYATDAMSGTGRFFRHVVLNDSRMMNWAQLTEIADSGGVTQATHNARQKILEALAHDRFGLAVASLGWNAPEVRPVALQSANNGAPVLATRASLIDRSYPLTRSALAYFNRNAGTPCDPLVREFLRYVLGPAGQAALQQGNDYLPLSPTAATAQVNSLN